MTHFSRTYFFLCTGGDKKETGRNREGQTGTARSRERQATREGVGTDQSSARGPSRGLAEPD